MSSQDAVNVLLVDDQPAKLLAFETILQDLGENLIKASSAQEALQHLLKTDVAILLIDVCMPDLDGFQLAAMIREHPRFQRTAIIFISAIQFTDVDLMRGYEMGAVDYVPVPVIPEVLRAKVRVFAELHRKTRQLEQLNRDLEKRVADRTAELEASNARLIDSERRKSLALAAGQMGSWDWDLGTGECQWDDGQYRIFGVDPASFQPTFENVRRFIHVDDLARIRRLIENNAGEPSFQTEARITRPTGQMRWCICAAAMTFDVQGRVRRISGVTIDITDLKEAETRRTLLVREVDHRARNTLALVQSIVRLTKAKSIRDYVGSIEGRIRALSTAHALLSESRWEGADLNELVDEELAPYRQNDVDRIAVSGPAVFLPPASAQILAIVLHELATNAAKYGAIATSAGRIEVSWGISQKELKLSWQESGGPLVNKPSSTGFGSKVISTSVVQQLGGVVDFDWRPEGLVFTMSASIGSVEPSPDTARKIPQLPQRPPEVMNATSGSRILLIEDEALVGMMMTDTLNELGYSVVGPFTSIADSVSAATTETFHAAILDINVKGELVYTLADVLAARQVPLIFVTGYGSEVIEERFKGLPVLQKPVDRGALKAILAAQQTGAYPRNLQEQSDADLRASLSRLN
jgi:two-component sensor histidine kinase/CheY-like chemotaxis protein